MEEQNSIEQMTVLMVEPGYEPYEKTIPNTLAAKQELVGGLITAIYPYEEMVAIVANDEGILLMRINSRNRKKMTKGARREIVRCEQTDRTLLRDLPSQ